LKVLVVVVIGLVVVLLDYVPAVNRPHYAVTYDNSSVKISGGVVGVEPPLENMGPPLQTLGKKAGGGRISTPPGPILHGPGVKIVKIYHSFLVRLFSYSL